ncbi:hypothetical protein ACQR1W_39790, partial [Bradyrhizobium sp. HKCCYLS1011]|uniref:hypothetical protein n=1 Tax=Bradyrhizobium sp. HKCCYLS1011 TaxID=3420733 RepID=UPI003EC0B7F8
ALVSSKCAKKCERAVLTNRPSQDLSPIVLKGQESLLGSVGQIRCLPSTRTVAWAASPDEQGRELDDGTK